MVKTYTITRRRFMAGCFSAGTIGCLLNGASFSDTAARTYDANEQIHALISTIDDLYMKHECNMEEQKKANLGYA